MDADRRRSSQWSVRLVVIAALVVATTSRAARAQDVTLQAAGGTGGDAYASSCGNQVLVGLEGQAGTNILGQAVVFNLRIWCVGVNADGSWAGAPSLVGNEVGKFSPNFNAVDMKCPTHMAVSGVKGRAGSYVSDIEIVCSSVGANGLLTGSPRGPDTFAGFAQIAGSSLTPDASYGLFLCPSNYPGKGIKGRAHDWIDQIAVVCGVPHVPLPVIASVTVQGNVVSGMTATGIVTLSAPAPTGVGGFDVAFTSQNGGFSISPSQIFFSNGLQSAPFVITAAPTASQTFATIHASEPGIDRPGVDGHFFIMPPSLAGLSLAATYVTSGNTTTGRVSLAGKAPSGFTVSLFTGDATVATVPSSVAVAAGDTAATFPVTLVGTNNACTSIRAALGGVTKTAYVAIAPPPTFSRNTKFPIGLTGTVGSSQVTVSFATTSSSARTVTLSSSEPSVIAIPSSVTVLAGTQSTKVNLTITNSFENAACATITARDASGGSNSLILMLNGSSVIAVAG